LRGKISKNTLLFKSLGSSRFLEIIFIQQRCIEFNEYWM